MKRWCGAVGAILCGLGLIVACAATSTEGGDGETHWLKTCTADADCGAAACVCGVCTLRCAPEQAHSCTGGPPGSRCYAGTDVAECAGAKSVPGGLCLPTTYGRDGGGGDAGVMAVQCAFAGNRVSDAPLDDGCKTGVCYGVLRLAYEDLSVRGYEVISAPATPVDGTEALKTANAVFAANANGPFIPQAIDAKPAQAGVILVSVEPLDYGAMALVGADSGKVIAAGSVNWAGGGTDDYWVPTEWKPAADIACSTTVATPTVAYTQAGACDGYPNVSFAPVGQATAVALRTNLAASFGAHGSFSAFTYLYTPGLGACPPDLAEYVVVLSQTR